MIPDRTFLILFVLTTLAMLVKVPWPVRESLALLCGAQTLRSHSKALRSDLR